MSGYLQEKSFLFIQKAVIYRKKKGNSHFLYHQPTLLNGLVELGAAANESEKLETALSACPALCMLNGIS